MNSMIPSSPVLTCFRSFDETGSKKTEAVWRNFSNDKELFN
jgi:hypothetical protein